MNNNVKEWISIITGAVVFLPIIVLLVHVWGMPPKVDDINERLIRLEEREKFYHGDGYGESENIYACQEDEDNPVQVAFAEKD